MKSYFFEKYTKKIGKEEEGKELGGGGGYAI